ncbi:MAG: amino acid permease [Bacteroidetes bacterium]|nr:amino acid permease [Bacteroidota bacterium]
MKNGKFGTFGGVFTPSILTILGVIMYLRLPWIVGQAGLWVTIGIIVVAHIISVTTGLSVASIATDKKVKAGGIYYIISRSLGLPIGGSLGIALFVGLSFSVSLYIIGFIESFLPVMGIASNINNIRLYGTLAIAAVTIVVLISTSLAIKTQYLILGAILLSLLSIFFGSAHLAPTVPLFHSADGVGSIMVLFSIFFPAVTGFTAGVQMSGDLKNPQKAIPVGTMAAIGIGFVIYTGMAVFLAYRVNSADLINNPGILSEIALVPGFLLAGIWGATLSSAMGSLLGAPRILQAMSADRITPGMFARGYGSANEPRNALAITFLIAEAGILIGELNVIAAIISIFFITTYGFINLSCAIENWASPDFRPSFRIPKWTSVLGAAASFLVMIQLDLLSFIGSSLILGVLYLYLQRRQLTLESGDTWEGVWSSVIRSGLHRLDKSVKHTRNWRPNIILFSGGVSKRPHLIEFGKWIVYKRGILSNFDLKEHPEDPVLFSKAQQVLHDSEETVNGIFSRQLSCNNIYDGMETISQVFGFSGVEPNTVMMGWARNTRDPRKFAHLVKHMSDLDYNILMLDYDLERGFGEHKHIDIWWRGGSNNTSLELTILKFLTASEDWAHAEARVLILVDDRSLVNRAYRNMKQILDEQRIMASVKVINNAIEKRPFTDVIKAESREVDLIMMGLPMLDDENSSAFVANVNSIVADLGSTLLVQASSFFEPLYIGIEVRTPTSEEEMAASPADTEVLFPPLTLAHAPEDGSTHDILLHTITKLQEEIDRAIHSFSRDSMKSIENTNRAVIEEMRSRIQHDFTRVGQQFDRGSRSMRRQWISALQIDCLDNFKRIFEEYGSDSIAQEREDFEQGLGQLLDQLQTVIENAPAEVQVFHERASLQPLSSDGLRLRLLKWRKRFRQDVLKQPVTVKMRLQKRLEYDVKVPFREALYRHEEAFGIISYQLISKLQKWIVLVFETLSALEIEAEEGDISAATIAQKMDFLIQQLNEIETSYKQQMQENAITLLSANHSRMQTLCDDAIRLDINRSIEKECRIPKTAAAVKTKMLQAPTAWQRNVTLMAHYTLVEVHMMFVQHQVAAIIRKLMNDFRGDIESRILGPLTDLESILPLLYGQTKDDFLDQFRTVINKQHAIDVYSMIQELDASIRAAIQPLPEKVEIIEEESFQKIETVQYEGTEAVSINLSRLVNHIIESDVIDPLHKRLVSVEPQLATSRNVAVEVVRLLQFHHATSETDAGTEVIGEQESLADLVLSIGSRVTKERTKVDGILEEMSAFASERLSGAFGKLNPYLISRTDWIVDQKGRGQESRSFAAGIRQSVQRSRSLINQGIVALLYRRSNGLLLARKMSAANSDTNASIDSLLSFTYAVSPRPELLAQLPYYYRQLFTGKQQIVREFTVGQSTEMKKAETIVRRYRQGFEGGLLVLGEPDSGKTALCYCIALEHFNKPQIFNLFAPEDGCIDVDRFRLQLRETLQVEGDFDEVFKTIPPGSVLVLHDLELWWERSQGGFAVVDEILRLIERYSAQCLFIVNCSTHSFRFMNRLKALDKVFLGIIHCEPYDAKQLQEAILLRHHTTGIKFMYRNQVEDRISAFVLAKLFTKYFDYSAGNIGVALHAWIGCIESYEAETMTIRAPRRPAVGVLTDLENEWDVWLQQFVLHKTLTTERLARLFDRSEAEIREKVNELKRSGFVVESSAGVLRLNPYTRPFIIQKFIEAKML